jgi:hypothetical protein
VNEKGDSVGPHRHSGSIGDQSGAGLDGISTPTATIFRGVMALS